MTHVTRCDIVCYIYSGIFLFFTVFIIDLSFYHITWHFETSAGPQYHDTMLHPTIYLSLGKSRQLQGDVALCALGRLSSFEHSCDATFSGFVLRSVSSQREEMPGLYFKVCLGLKEASSGQGRYGDIPSPPSLHACHRLQPQRYWPMACASPWGQHQELGIHQLQSCWPWGKPQFFPFHFSLHLFFLEHSQRVTEIYVAPKKIQSLDKGIRKMSFYKTQPSCEVFRKTHPKTKPNKKWKTCQYFKPQYLWPRSN